MNKKSFVNSDNRLSADFDDRSPAAEINQFVADVYQSALIKAAASAGLELSSAMLEQSMLYIEQLLSWNTRINLTALTSPEDVATRHFLDSWSILKHIDKYTAEGPKRIKLADVGTGAGFPGLPVKIARPEISVSLFDSLLKRVKFLQAIIDKLQLNYADAVHGRAEELARNRLYRDKFDIVTARAVASLPVLCEYCLPFVRPGGVFIAMKGQSEDADDASKAIARLGAEVEQIDNFVLAGTDMKRSLIIFRKVSATPREYPRKAGKPQSDPLV